MLKSTAILSAVLIGLAVPTSAQSRTRGPQGNGVRLGVLDSQDRRPANRVTRTQPSSRRPDRAPRGGRDRGLNRRGPAVTRERRGSFRPPLIPSVNRIINARPRVHYHYETRQVWVPGACRQVLVPAQYEERWDPHCRQYVRVCIREAYYRTVQDPGHYEYRRVKVAHRTRGVGAAGFTSGSESVFARSSATQPVEQGG